MSFLAPLYLLGGLAISLPVLLHLIRRTPRGRQPFSSLMFLSPSPPRITRRSRIEHWLLLILRATVIGLLALAFARPFLRTPANLLLDRGPGRQVAVLLDTSASMRRGDLWKQAVAQAEDVFANLSPNDVAALFQFDSKLRTVVDFPEPTVDNTTHLILLRNSLKELSPSWHATNLGQALTTVADSLTASRRDRGDDHPGQIVVISDMQQGSNLAALQGFEWPREILLTVKTVRPTANNNAAVRLLANTAEIDIRARVSNTADSTQEEFRIGWQNATGELLAPTTVYVPAGQARVVKLAERPIGTDRLHLTGDGHPFDNDFYVGPIVQREFNVTFLGDDAADDPRGLRYFLDRVWQETPRRKVVIRDQPSKDLLSIPPGQRLDLVVSSGISDPHRESLRRYIESGGVALLLAADEPSSQSIVAFLAGVQLAVPGDPQPTRQGSTTKDLQFVLLSELDFLHPVFATFADPRFGDFTKVRFWKHQRFQLQPAAQARVLAQFDDGVPALWEQPLGSGKVFVFASSWRPADSQLALSSKFVPLLSSVLNYAAGVASESPLNAVVGDSIPLPTGQDNAASVTTSDGTEVKLAARQADFTATDAPGIYQLKSSLTSQTFAVNLASTESDTAPLPADRLEQLGVRIGETPSLADQAERERQLRDIELESRQKLWQWLLVVVIGVLGVETFVAGRAAQKQETRDESTT